jgi:hypothetical protein
MTPPAAALRRRALSTLGSPTAPSTCAAWPTQHPTFDVPAGMRGIALGTLDVNHNSIPATLRSIVAATADLPSVAVDRDAYGAAKQVVPPRGVPR